MRRRDFVQLIATVGAGGLVSAAAGTTSPTSAPPVRREVTFHVKGFSCVTCAVGLDTMLKQKGGVLSSHSTYPAGVVVIQFDPDRVSEIELRTFIGDMGFTVEKPAEL